MKLNVVIVNIVLLHATCAYSTTSDTIKKYFSQVQNTTVPYLQPYITESHSYIKKHGLDVKAQKAQVVVLSLSAATAGLLAGMMIEVYKKRKIAAAGPSTFTRTLFSNSDQRTILNECNKQLKHLRRWIFVPLLCACTSGYTTYLTVSPTEQNKQKLNKPKRNHSKR